MNTHLTEKNPGHLLPRPVRRLGVVRLAITSIVALFLVSLWGMLIGGRLQAQEIISSSMEPTISRGDRVLVSGISDHEIRRGEIVVVRPQTTGDALPLIKRVVGMPGDTVFVYGSQVFVNRIPTPEEAVRLGMSTRATFHRVNVPADHYFVLGDNREQSFDSVFFGPVPRSDIIGTAFMRYAPLDRFGALGAGEEG